MKTSVRKIRKEHVTCLLMIVVTIATSLIIWNPYYTFFCLVECAAVYEDVQTQEVHDLIHIVATVPMIIFVLLSWGKISGNIIDFILPTVFVIITWFARGASDNILMMGEIALFMSIYAYSNNDKVSYITILLGFLIGYILQILIQIIDCKYHHIKWSEKSPKAFIPALLIGCETICVAISI